MKVFHRGSGLLLLWWAHASLTAPAAWGGGMAQGKGSWSPSFEISSPIVTLHEPIYVEFSVRNGTNEHREFDLGKNRKTGFDRVLEITNSRRGSSLHPGAAQGFNV